MTAAGFDYQVEADAIITILKDANTTTSSPYLSQSLTSIIDNDNIQNMSPASMPIRGDRLPALFLDIDRATEQFESIGETGVGKNLKRKSVSFRIYAVYPRSQTTGGMQGSQKDNLNEVYRLARNIEAVFETNFNLSNRALWCNPANTVFSSGFQLEGGTLVKVADIQLDAEYLFR